MTLAILVVSRVAQTYELMHVLWFDPDSYFLLEAGRWLRDVGVGTVGYVPHSTEGWDVLLWSYYLPVYVHAALAAAFELQFHQLPLVWFAQFGALAAATAFLLRRFLDRPLTIVALAALFLDPVFLKVSSQHYHAVALLFVLLAVAAADQCFRLAGRASLVLASVSGVLVAASVLSFTAIGVPLVFALTGFFAFERGSDAETLARRAARFVWFALGGLALAAAFVADVVTRLDPAALRDLLLTLAYHYSGEGQGGGGGVAGWIVRAGYFGAGVVVSPWGPTLLPVAIGAVALLMVAGRNLSVTERRLLHLAVALIASWLICGVLLPRNIYAPRMVAILPVCFAAVLLILSNRRVAAPVLWPALAAALALTAVGSLFHLLGQPGPTYALAGAATLAIAAGGLAAAAARRWLRASSADAFGHIGAGAAVLLVLLLPWSLLVTVGQLISGASFAVRSPDPVPAWESIRPGMLALAAPHLKPGDRVLTNVAMTEYFGAGVRRHLLRGYRGLTNGATADPADNVVLVGNAQSTAIHPGFSHLEVGSTLYFQGHTYCLSGRAELTPQFYALTGAPGVCAETAQPVFPAEFVPLEAVQAYVRWRRVQGLDAD